MIERRSFLQTLLIGGAGLIAPLEANALVMGDRYARLVSAMKEVLDIGSIHNRCQQAYDLAAERAFFTAAVEKKNTFPVIDLDEYFADWSAVKPFYGKKMNELFRVLQEEFGDMTAFTVDPAGTKAKVGAIFTKQLQIDVLSEDDLRRYEDVIVVIGCMRYIASAVPFTPQREDIAWFITRYMMVITGADRL